MKNTVLEKILESKKNWITNRKNLQPLNTFFQKISKSNRSLNNTIKLKCPAFILEIKRASPSLGIIRKNFDIMNIINIYNKYASAISVVTDSQYFQGSFKYLLNVHLNSSLPILCKDFIIDPYQIYLARYYQANGILLMLSILNDNEYLYLSSIAKDMNMDILTEVNNEQELQRAILLKSKIIGINNRNLHDLSINMNKTKLIAPLIPKEITIISESGFSNYQYIRKYSSIVDGFLIGSHLMKQSNLSLSIKKIIFGKNKVCGLTNIKDVKVCAKAGAIFGGIIFIPKSPRYVFLDVAKNIVTIKKLKYIGVFQNENIERIVFYAINLNLYAIQLHGSESQSYIHQLRINLPKKIHIWKVFSINNFIPLCNFRYVQNYIYDNYQGGSGVNFNWKLIDKKISKNILLAGGLNLNNCIKASYLGFSGLDFNSGVEISPGIKDSVKIFKVFKKLRYR